MSYYVAAYLIFWAALFGYLVAMARRQTRLVERAERLVERLSHSDEARQLEANVREQ